MSGEKRILIDGELRESSSGATFENINPATEEVLGVVADGTEADMDAAITAARRSFDEGTWSNDLAFRKHCLEQLQAALVEEKEEIRAELIAEGGVPALMTWGPALDFPLAHAIPWVVGRMDTFAWERRLEDAGTLGPTKKIVYKEPVGVVGAITPWNVPFDLIIVKVAQILATGNTMILKPAPDTPWSGTRWGRIVAEKTDIPAGVFNVVTSSDHLRGEQLVVDPRVDAISFTGSTGVGRRIMEKGAPTLKRLFLELGGKSAQIFLDDADLANGLQFAAMSTCMHGGQGCAMPTRLLLPRSRYEEGLAIVAEKFAEVKYGDPTDPGNIQGPQINAKQRERVLGLIDKGIEEGARLVTGGKRPEDLDKGYYVEPTLFADVDNSMTIAQEEIFGPVLVVIPFEDDDDAVRIANDSQYGLAGIVNSASDERALAVAKRIRTGSIGVNGSLFYEPSMPFGGYKASGIGRQNGDEGFEQYLETKSIASPL